jgi:hypothetical protein
LGNLYGIVESPEMGHTAVVVDCRCRAKRRRLVNILLWILALYGILSLRGLPGDYSRPCCGPWGCLPPIQALAAVHGAWALVTATAVPWLIRTQPARTLRCAGIVLGGLGASGLVVITGHDLSIWPLDVSTDAPTYRAQHLLCSIAMATDLPLVRTAIAGAVTWYVGTHSRFPSAPSH